MHVYCVTAVDWQGNAVAGWLTAENPDDATTKAIRNLPGGRVTHLVRICKADLKTFKRNKLDRLLSITDRIEFTGQALLELVEFQDSMMKQLQAAVSQQVQAVAEHIKKETDE